MTVAALCLAAAIALGAQTSSLEGQRVIAVRVVTETGQVLQENPAGLPLAADKPYSAEDERASLRKLYRSGLYADIRAVATPEPGGLRLDYVVRQNYFVNVVRVNGLSEPPNEATALASMRLGLGETFHEGDLTTALEQLRQVLSEDGLYQAKLSSALHPDQATRQMDITVTVTPGPRARLGTVTVRDQTEYSAKELLHRAKLKLGKPITSRRLDRGAERVRKFLVKKDHLGARVSLRRGDYKAATNTLPIELDVNAGPKVRVGVEGAHISKGQLRNLVPIYEEGAVDEDLLQEGRRNVRDYLQRQGFFDAGVKYRTESDAKTGAQRIIYEVDRGPRHRVVRISFHGNHYFDEDLLRARMTIVPASLLSRGRFSPLLFQADEDSIRQMYFSNGFLQAQVTGQVQDNAGGKKGDLAVSFEISEGVQTRVASLQLTGNHALRDEELLSVVGSTAGEPYSASGVASDRENLLAFYYDEGFPQANVQAVAVPAGPPNRIALTYHITEGQQVLVDRVLLGGYEHTRPGVIQREVQIKPGGPLREGDVVETQRRLYNLGIFNRVQVATQNPNGADAKKTELVEVEETKRYTVGYGGGIEVQRLGGTTANPVGTTLNFSPRVIFEISKTNVGGRAQTLAFKARASTLQYRGLLSYTVPDFLAKPKLTLLLTGFADKTLDVRTFTSSRYEGSLQVVQNYSRATSFLYRYSFRHVLVNASSLRVAPNEIPLFSQPTKISAFGITWIRDRRDSPADASRGSYNTADFSLAAKGIGSTASFTRFFFQNSTYHPIGRSLVFARSTRFGDEEPLGKSTSLNIPLPERFFAGGGNSLRGFALNQAGPRDAVTGFPVGGLSLLVFNQELRFPMELPFVDGKLGGAIFYDAGNVYSQFRDITFSPSPSSPSSLNYLSHTIGFGFRYHTPIGPVRLDLGYQLNPAQFSVACLPGAPGCVNGLQLTRLPHFQFFFNIGSIF